MARVMGQQLVVYGDRTAVVADRALRRLRDLLSAEASKQGRTKLEDFIIGWTYQSSGVWTDDDFDTFFAKDASLERDFVALLGVVRDRVSASGAEDGVELVRSIDRLRDLFPRDDDGGVSPNAVEVLWTEDGKARAEILRGDDGLFRIALSREVRGEGEWEPAVYWSSVGGRCEVILTDTIENARVLALEELRGLGS